MHSSPFSKKYQARLLGKNQREKYPFTFKLISALDSNSREKKSDSTRRYYRRCVVRESSPRVRGFETRLFAFKALFAKSSGSIYSLFLSEDPPANEGSQSKESTARKRRYEADISSRTRFLWLRCLEHIFCEKLPFFHKAFITVFSFLRILTFFASALHVNAF